MPSISRSVLYAAIAALIAGATPGLGAGRLATAAPVSPNANPTADKPSQGKIPEDPATSGSSTEPLSEKLDRSGGVIHPPSGVDPGIRQTPPAIGSHSTPVIPPPGSPGGKRGVNPK
ncbi:MAG TPA: hypothetical protein VEK82_10570 [Stellaceae bacterium]|nr:hypothetical protein [Stellaceae bacterium]